MMKNLFILFILTVVLIVSGLIIDKFNIADVNLLAQVSPGVNEAVLYFSPATGNFNTGSSFSVNLRLGASSGITSIKIFLDFNPALISVSSINTGSSVFSNWWENTYNNSTGRVQLQGSSPSPGFTGDGLVATINFSALSAGTAGLNYNASSLALKVDDTNILNLTRSEAGSYTIQTSDTTPPTRSTGAPSGILAAGTTQTTMSLATNENATCKYGTVANTAYASLPSTFSTTGSLNHSTTISGLTNGSSYTYYVRCQDVAANANPDDFTITFSVATPPCGSVGLTAPVVSPSSPTAGQSFNITCPTSVSGYDCVNVSVGATACTFSQWSGNNVIFNCAGQIAGSYTAKCSSRTGTISNCCADERIASFTVQPADTTSPTRSTGAPSGILAAGTTQTTMSLATNENATCKYGTVANTAYASLPSTFSTTGSLNHSTTISGLTNGTSYNYYVRCLDAAGNANTSDFTISFSVALPSFTITDVSPRHLFRDQTNNLTITGTDFTLSTNFSLRFVSGTTDVASLTVQPQTNSSFVVSITSAQISPVSVGFYDLKLERSADTQSKTYTQKILVTVLGDISGITPGQRDGKVNIYDVSRMLSNWGSVNPLDLAEYDINSGPGGVSAGKIDLYDANKMMANWLP